MVILFILSSFPPFFDMVETKSYNPNQSQVVESEVQIPVETAFSPNLDFWIEQEVAKPMILT